MVILSRGLLRSFLAGFLDFFATFSALHTFIMPMTVEIRKKRIQRRTSLSLSETEHTDLIQRACSDPDAFARLYLMHYKDVFNYCIRRLFDHHSAEEVEAISAGQNPAPEK
jgi:cytidylate kinase